MVPTIDKMLYVLFAILGLIGISSVRSNGLDD